MFVGSAGARTIADLALYAHGTGELPPGVEGGLDAQAVYRVKLGPENGTLTVRTGKGGAASKAGHNLVLEVQRWQGSLTPDEVTLTADARSLRVVSGSGGISPLGDDEKRRDRADDRRGGARGREHRVPLERRHRPRGRLRRRGRARPARRLAPARPSRCELDGDHLTGRAQVKQTDFKLKPYSALFGTLKVADVVEVTIDATLPKGTQMVELDHAFSTGKDADYNWDAVLDLDRIIPCVEGGKVLERESPDLAKAEIKVKMGAMSMTFKGTVEVAEKDEAARRAVLRVKSKDTGGSGYANADVAFALDDGGGDDPHRGQDHRQGGLDGRGRGRDRARRADQGLHDQAREDLMAERMVMRQIREGEVPPDGGTALQDDPDRPGLPRQRPLRLRLRASAATCSRPSMALEAMNKRVRIKCGRCRTINVAVYDHKGET